jgi:hypothetical protein
MVTCRGGAAEARLGTPHLRLLWTVTFSYSLSDDVCVNEVDDACVNEVNDACVNEANNACVNEVDNEVNSELGARSTTTQ